jgi:hypothetical protein
MERFSKMKQETKILLAVLLLSSTIFAAVDTEVAGNLKIRGMGSGPVFSNASKRISQEFLVSTGRLKTMSALGEQLSFDFAYDLSVTYNHINELRAVAVSGTETFKYRAYDLHPTLERNEINSNNAVYATQNLDRAFLTYSTENVDFFAGRQAVSFGSGRFINPTDVLVPYPLTQIDKEEREGVDALRLKLPISEMGEFDAGVVFGDEAKNENNAYYVNGKYPIWGWDSSLMLMQFRENFLYGIDLQGEILGAGIWFEGSHVKSEHSNDYERFSIGADFNFPFDLYTFIEYHYNGAGTDQNEDYFLNALTQPYQDGGVYLLGQDYLTLGLTYSITPLIGFSQNLIVNLNDSSFLFSPKIEYNVLENHYIDFGIFLGVGDKSQSYLDLKSEFGTYSDSAYLGYRVYF